MSATPEQHSSLFWKIQTIRNIRHADDTMEAGESQVTEILFIQIETMQKEQLHWTKLKKKEGKLKILFNWISLWTDMKHYFKWNLSGSLHYIP